MLPSEVWINAVEYIKQLLPQCEVRRQYAPTDELEQLATYERPVIWAALDAIDTDTVTTDADTIGQTYTLSLTCLWRVRDYNNPIELDNRLDALQAIMTSIRQKIIDTPAGRLYFGLPSVTTPYDTDYLQAKSIYAAELTVSVTNYIDRNAKMELINNAQDNSAEPQE